LGGGVPGGEGVPVGGEVARVRHHAGLAVQEAGLDQAELRGERGELAGVVRAALADVVHDEPGGVRRDRRAGGGVLDHAAGGAEPRTGVFQFRLRCAPVRAMAMACCQLTSDACIIRDQHFFVRGLIRVPIVGHAEHFEWGVWVWLSEENFWRTMDTWETPGRQAAPPMFGWLSTELPTFAQPTLNLRTLVHTQPVGFRPHIELEPTEHPLAVEQRAGVTWNTLVKQVELLLQQG
jgi:hypothetical protein